MWDLNIDKAEITIPDPRNDKDSDDLTITITSKGLSADGRFADWESISRLILEQEPDPEKS